MKIHTGQLGPCHWQVLIGKITQDGWVEYVNHLMGLPRRLMTGEVILDVWHNTGQPNALQRAEFTSRFMHAQGVERIAAHSFVTNSVVTRGTLAAVNWVIKRPFAERAFATPSEGIDWLVTQNVHLDGPGLLADMQLSVPGFDDLPW